MTVLLRNAEHDRVGVLRSTLGRMVSGGDCGEVVLAYSVERTLGDLNGQVSASDRQAIEQLISELRQAVKGEDATAIRSAMERVIQDM